MANPRATIDIYPGTGNLNNVLDRNGNVATQPNMPTGRRTNIVNYHYQYFEIETEILPLYKARKDYAQIEKAQTAGQGCYIQWGNTVWKIC